MVDGLLRASLWAALFALPGEALAQPVLQLIPAALALFGGYDVFSGAKRHPTARDVFTTNEIALHVILLSGHLMSRNAPSLSPPCK